MTLIPKGSSAVMAGRIEPTDSLDYFPTPPWATRALCEHVLFEDEHYARHLFADHQSLPIARSLTCWEPACGEGHMVHPLSEYFRDVIGTDVHDYGKGFGVGSFIGIGPDRTIVRFAGKKPDWIITNPPFKLAAEFIERALQEAEIGVAMFCRSVFIESEQRYKLFQKHPLTIFSPFTERVCLTKGRWEPKGSTATSYAWFVWLRRSELIYPRVVLIPPGRKRILTRMSDLARFAA